MNRNQIHNILWILGFILIIYLFWYVSTILIPASDIEDRNKFRNFYDKKCYTLATCIQGGEGKYADKKYSYTINGKNYITGIDKDTKKLVLNTEMFLLVYNPDNYKDVNVILGHPFIQDSTNFTTTVATTIKEEKEGVDSYIYGNIIEFSFIVDGEKIDKKFKHDILFPDTRYKKIDAKKTYKIIYNINDPRIAYPVLEDSLIPRVKF